MKSRNNNRIPELDGWRVLLVFIVSWFHIWQQSWLAPALGSYSLDYLVRSGYMPVDGTILLSGFLLFLPWAKAMHDHTPLPSARDYYRRRIARIVPSYYAFILLSLAIIILPQGQYPSVGRAVVDLLTHFSFTHTFSRVTYLGSPIFGGTWTLAVEAQMYLLFPLLARAASQKPLAVFLGMAAFSAYFRGICLWQLTEYQMVVNQLAGFLDVYAMGMAAAMVYVRLDSARARAPFKWWQQLIATAAFVLGCWAALRITRAQAASGSISYEAIQSGQMMRRPYYNLSLCVAMLSLPFCLAPLRVLFGNPVMRFLGGISMNYYLVHQVVAVQLKYHHIPYSEFDLPNMAGDIPWQYTYTFLCFGLSLVIAAAMTYLIEKPCAYLLRRWFARSDRKKALS